MKWHKSKSGISLVIVYLLFFIYFAYKLFHCFGMGCIGFSYMLMPGVLVSYLAPQTEFFQSNTVELAVNVIAGVINILILYFIGYSIEGIYSRRRTLYNKWLWRIGIVFAIIASFLIISGWINFFKFFSSHWIIPY